MRQLCCGDSKFRDQPVVFGGELADAVVVVVQRRQPQPRVDRPRDDAVNVPVRRRHVFAGEGGQLRQPLLSQVQAYRVGSEPIPIRREIGRDVRE